MEPRRERRFGLDTMVGLFVGVLIAFGPFPGLADGSRMHGLLADAVGDHLRQGELETRTPLPAMSYTPVPRQTVGQDAGDPPRPLKADPTWPEPRRDCINLRLLRNFQVIDRRHAIFIASVRRPYLVTFAGVCPELRFALRILTASRTGFLCGGAGERIIVRRFRCLVRTIERVASEDQARYLVAVRTAKPATDDTTPPGSRDIEL